MAIQIQTGRKKGSVSHWEQRDYCTWFGLKGFNATNLQVCREDDTILREGEKEVTSGALASRVAGMSTSGQ